MANQGRTVFSQLMDFLPTREFRRCVDKSTEDYEVRSFTYWDQFLCLAFAQLTYRESLRDIEACLRSVGIKLYHLGIRGKVSRSTLAEANLNRDANVFAEFCRIVMAEARKLYSEEKFSVDIKQVAYCLDASVIDLCLTLCPWSHFDHTSRGGVKLHTLLDLRGNIPSFIAVTTRKTYELAVLDQIPLEAGAFYIMDRGYFDWKRLYRITESQASFIIRLRRGIRLYRRYSNPTIKGTNVISDQIVASRVSTKVAYHRSVNTRYPSELRKIRYRAPGTNTIYVFLTNNFVLPAATIADLYKARWQVELFFKWIKQHLRIKAFYGTSKNAISIQIHVAVTIYLLASIVKKTLGLKQELYTVLQILSVSLFEKKPLFALFLEKSDTSTDINHQNQLNLWANPTGH